MTKQVGKTLKFIRFIEEKNNNYQLFAQLSSNEEDFEYKIIKMTATTTNQHELDLSNRHQLKSDEKLNHQGEFVQIKLQDEIGDENETMNQKNNKNLEKGTKNKKCCQFRDTEW